MTDMTYVTMIEGSSFVVTKTMTSSVGTVSTLVSERNSARRGFVLFNNSANSCYLSLSTASVAAHCAAIVPTFNQFVFPYPYVGEISVIRNSGSGVCTLWELVAE